MKKTLIVITFFLLFSHLSYSQEKNDSTTIIDSSLSAQVSAGYYFGDNNTNLYGLGFNFLIPINHNNGLFSFSAIFEINGYAGKYLDEKAWGLNLLPGISWQINSENINLFVHTDLLIGLGTLKLDSQNDNYQGISAIGRIGLGYKNFSIDYGSTLFFSKQLIFDKPIHSIIFRYRF